MPDSIHLHRRPHAPARGGRAQHRRDASDRPADLTGVSNDRDIQIDENTALREIDVPACACWHTPHRRLDGPGNDPALSRAASGRTHWAKPSTTRRVVALFFSILVTTMAPISAVLATCVPPQGCRSISAADALCPPMRMVRMRPVPRGGCTLMLLTSAGFASSSASLIEATVSGCAAATSAAMPALRACLSSGSVMAKSSLA